MILRERTRAEAGGQHALFFDGGYLIQYGSPTFKNEYGTRSISFSMIGLDDSGINRVGAQNTIVSPNTVGRRIDRLTCGGLM